MSIFDYIGLIILVLILVVVGGAIILDVIAMITGCYSYTKGKKIFMIVLYLLFLYMVGNGLSWCYSFYMAVNV